MTTESTPRRAGRASSRHPAPRLDSLEAVRREMARVYRQASSGAIAPQDGTRFIYMLTSIASLIEASDIERRLEAIEGDFHREN